MKSSCLITGLENVLLKSIIVVVLTKICLGSNVTSFNDSLLCTRQWRHMSEELNNDPRPLAIFDLIDDTAKQMFNYSI